MAYNLKKFATEADYSAAIGSLSYPNVSWVENGDTLHYNLEMPQVKFLAKNGNTVLKTVYCDGNPQLTVEEARSGINRLDLTDVIVSDCVTSLEEWIFYNTEGGFTNLSAVTLPNTITQIPYNFVRNCIALKSFDMPSGVTSIGNSAFRDCSGLTSIDIPSGVTSIGSYAFNGCTSLTSIDIPSGVTSIGNSVFYGCSGLTSIDIPSGVTSIGGSAFRNCSSLLSIIVNATTPPTLGSNVFNSTNENMVIYVPAGSVDTYKSAWSQYADRIQAIPEAPKVVATYNVTTTSKPTEITNYQTLSGISKMYVDGVELPNVVADYTFSTTGTHTVEFELADSTKIPYYMFRSSGFWPLTVIVPSSVTSFEDYAFYQGPINSLTIEATVPPTLLGSNSLVYSKTAPAIYVPAASVDTYKAASGWSTYASNIQAIS